MSKTRAGAYIRLRNRRQVTVVGGLFLAMLCVIVASVGLGSVVIKPLQVIAILLGKIGVSTPWEYTVRHEMVLMAIRLPRVILSVLVGAGLAVSGAAIQGLFRNPLADPGLIGVTSGAAFFAVLGIVFGSLIPSALFPFADNLIVPFAAFIGSIVITYLVYKLATDRGQTSVATMLLAGIGINALAAAGVGSMILIADEAQLRDITFWTLGSMGGATWSALAVVAPMMLLGIYIGLSVSHELNAMLLGESEARHLGVNTGRLKKMVIFMTGLTVGCAVAVTGSIAFVGLVVPHLIRISFGPDHKILMPGSLLLGATLLPAADLLSRLVIAPAELPIGLVTAFLGAPFFLWLLLRYKKTAMAGF